MAETQEAPSNPRVVSETSVDYFVRSDGPVPVIEAAGEIDMSNAHTLARCLSVFGPGDPVIIDMRQLEYMDSSGINVIASTATRGVNLALRHPQRPVRRVLDICGLEHMLTVEH